MCGITAIIRRELSEDNSQKSSNLFPELYESLFFHLFALTRKTLKLLPEYYNFHQSNTICFAYTDSICK